MKDSQGNLVLGRTRWRRFAIVLLPAAVLGAGLMAGVANGAVPISLNVSGQTFQVAADELRGTDFAQYPGFVTTPGSQSPIPVAASSIGHATLKNLCQSVKVPNPLGGHIILKIRGGQGDKIVTADGLLIGLSDLAGDATFTNIRIGVDASTVDGAKKGSKGDFAQDADAVVIKDLKQTAYYTEAGTFAVQGLSLKLEVNGATCF